MFFLYNLGRGNPCVHIIRADKYADISQIGWSFYVTGDPQRRASVFLVISRTPLVIDEAVTIDYCSRVSRRAYIVVVGETTFRDDERKIGTTSLKSRVAD